MEMGADKMSVTPTMELFLQRKAATGRLYVPTLSAILLGAALLSQTYVLYLALGEQFIEQIDLLVIFGLYRLIEGFIIWGLFTASFYILAVLAGGTPLFGHIFRVAGWGLAPFIPAALIWAMGQYYALQAVAYPDWEPFGMEQEWAKLNEYTAATHGDPLLVGSTVLGCTVLSLSAYIWAHGLTTACDVSRRRAWIIASIPLMFYSCWRLLGAFGV